MSGEKAFGIDLGTTYSAIAMINDFGQPEVIENFEGDQTTPSVVYFEDADNFAVGKVAKNGQKVFPDDTVALIKRLMGEKRTMDFHGNEYTPEVISALILRQLVEEAQEATGESTNQVVITVPAYFGLMEKNATRLAGEIAGLEVLSIVTEPVAAALSMGIELTDPKTLFIYDLGGGTFDCTVMDLGPGGVEVVAVDGDRRLGGADWDQALFALVLDKFVAVTGLDEDPSLDDAFYQELLSNVEDAKKSLTRRGSVKVRCTYGQHTEMIEVSREEFEVATRHLLDQTLEVARRTLASAQQKKPGLQVDEFLLVGGSSRMPMIKDALENELGWTMKPTEFDLAVAKGAAVYAQGLLDAGPAEPARSRFLGAAPVGATDAPQTSARRFMLGGVAGTEVEIRNVLSKSIGTTVSDGPEGAKIFFLANQGDQLPLEARETFYTSVDHQKAVPMDVWEQAGEVPSELLEANVELTTRETSRFLLPPLPAGSPIEMVIKVDADGLLHMEALEPQSGRVLTLQVQVSTMQPAEVDAARDMVQGLIRSE